MAAAAAGHGLQAVIGAMGGEAEEIFDTCTGLIDTAGWNAMYAAYRLHADHSGTKHGPIPDKLKVPALCKDISSYSADALEAALKKKAARAAGRSATKAGPAGIGRVVFAGEKSRSSSSEKAARGRSRSRSRSVSRTRGLLGKAAAALRTGTRKVTTAAKTAAAAAAELAASDQALQVKAEKDYRAYLANENLYRAMRAERVGTRKGTAANVRAREEAMEKQEREVERTRDIAIKSSEAALKRDIHAGYFGLTHRGGRRLTKHESKSS